MSDLSALTPEQRAALRAELPALEKAYGALRGGNAPLDLTRGKPAADQLSLSDQLDGILKGDYRAADGTDTRNYGGLRGLPEARALGAALLGVPVENVLAGNNSSLALMYLYLETAMLFGVRGAASAWQTEARNLGGTVKFLCPSPGYDRHFAICQQLSIEMITVGMDENGPDMDRVEALVAADSLIKGIWCVPKHSNPTGCVYGDAIVERFATLPKLAGPNFRIMWDNAYAIHDLTTTAAPVLASLQSLAERAGTLDAVVQTTSTSKITFAGGGVSFLATSAPNLAAFEQRLSFMTIGPDKVNQLRHARMLPDQAAVHAHMSRQAALLRPKFALVMAQLEQDLGGTGSAHWSKPVGGYFISLDTAPGLAKEVIQLAADLGVKITPAGATFPYGRDPLDSNIRIAPTFPPLDDLQRAIKAFTLCVKLATARHASATI